MFTPRPGAATANGKPSGTSEALPGSITPGGNDGPGNGGHPHRPLGGGKSDRRVTFAVDGDMEVDDSDSNGGGGGFDSDGAREKHVSVDLADDAVFAAAASPASRRGGGVHDELVRQADMLVANGCQVSKPFIR